MRVLLYNEYNIRTRIFCFMKESVQDRPAAVCDADRPTARESTFPTITLKIFGKRERKNPYELDHYYGFKL